MKRLAILGVVLVGLVAVYYLLNMPSTSGELEYTNERAIALKDFTQVQKIWIKLRGEEGYFLTKKGNNWYADEGIQIDKYIMSNIQRAITQPVIKFIPDKKLSDYFVGSLNQVGIEVRIFGKNDAILRDYWIGANTNDELGTSYLVKGAKQPYVMEIPFTDGTLRSIFQGKINDIRERTVLSIATEDIQSIKVNYPKNTDSAFEVKQEAGGRFSVAPLYVRANAETRTISQKAMENYLIEFKQLNCEAFENTNPQRKNINARVPFCVYDITLKNGEVKTMKFWSMNEFMDQEMSYNELENLKMIERLFLESSWGDFYLVQMRQFKNIFVSYEYFFI